MCDKICGVDNLSCTHVLQFVESTDVYHKCTAYIIYSTYFITNVQLTIYTAHILSQMYSLDYLFNRCDHKCTAWIIYSTDCITNVQLGLSTQEIFITNEQLRLSTQQIVPQIYT
jgi:hypothetical protein